MNTTSEKFEEWYGNNNLLYSNDVKNMAFKAWESSAQALLSQGEPVYQIAGDKEYWYDCNKQSYDDALAKKYKRRMLFTSPDIQGEPVAWRIKNNDDIWIYYESEQGAKYQIENNSTKLQALFAASPSTEALKKDNAELIEYAKKLRKSLEYVRSLSCINRDAELSARSALNMQQPNAMQE